MKFPFYRQLDAMDCGPTSLRMVARFYGKSYSLQHLRGLSHITREGVSMLGISDAAESVGSLAANCRSKGKKAGLLLIIFIRIIPLNRLLKLFLLISLKPYWMWAAIPADGQQNVSLIPIRCR